MERQMLQVRQHLPRLGRLPVAVLLATAVLAQGAAVAQADTPTGDPSANLELSSATTQACQTDPNSQACISSALADINAARADEGVVPMVLPSTFSTMSVPVQLMVVANLERVARGLIPALGLAAPLNSDSATGAAADNDPSPTNWYGDMYAANWAGGFPSTLEADFAWMYDDGPGSGNLDCTSTSTSGCWGHRHDILMAYDAPLVMGAAETTGQYGPSMAELFVGGDTETAPGHPDQPLSPSWAMISGDNSGSGMTQATAPSAGHGARATTASGARVLLSRLPGRVVSGHTVKLSGKITSALAGHRVRLERWTPWGWMSMGSSRLGSDSRFSFRVRETGRGRVRLRVVLAGAAATTSRVFTLRVVR